MVKPLENKPCYMAKVKYEPRPPGPAFVSRFSSMKVLVVFLLPPRWDASPPQGYHPKIKSIAGSHLCTWVKTPCYIQ